MKTFKYMPKIWKIRFVILGILFFWNVPIFLTFLPSLEDTSPDEKFRCYLKTSFIPSKLYDSEVQVEEIKSGKVVTARKLYGGWFEENPINLTWDEDSKSFIYDYSAEAIGETSIRFYVNESPFEVTNDNPEEKKIKGAKQPKS